MTHLFDRLDATNFVVPASEIDSIEEAFEKMPPNPKSIYYYNEFRIANAASVKKKRPQILVGEPVCNQFPSIHTLPLLRLADVVCLNSILSQTKPSWASLRAGPLANFQDILLKLPPGFTPDFYWSYQTEFLHQINRGIENAPFPIFASVCHMFDHLTIEAIYSLFDRVIPISPQFIPIMDKKFPGKSLSIPFGANWGSFFPLTPQYEDKKYDLCVTFSPHVDAQNRDRRKRVMEMVEQFQKKHPQYTIFFAPKRISREAYFDILKSSWITINVVGMHGPYNYRTLEAMALGSMVFQYNWTDGFFHSRFDELFTDSVHGVGFTDDTFEEKLLYYLSHKDKITQIARQAYTYSLEKYRHENLYQPLIEEAKKIIPKERKVINPITRIYYYQCNSFMMGFAHPGSVDIPWMQQNNEMVLGKTEYIIAYAHYLQARSMIPPDMRWILEWNLYLTAKHFNHPHDPTLLLELLSHDPVPFDEERLLFRYDFNNPTDFSLCNIEIMKSIDDPKARARHYQNYCKTYLAKEGILT